MYDKALSSRILKFTIPDTNKDKSKNCFHHLAISRGLKNIITPYNKPHIATKSNHCIPYTKDPICWISMNTGAVLAKKLQNKYNKHNTITGTAVLYLLKLTDLLLFTGAFADDFLDMLYGK